jgi:RsiW-degrading membrane proteinase PrsW (M82 family)
MEFIYLLTLAAAPGLAICIYIFWKDKFEKEPLSLLAKCFFMGALSIIPALILSLSLESLLPPNLFLEVFIGIALSEELSKYLFLRYYAFRKKSFNEPYDGITYSVMISMGFATLENILYTFEHGYEVGFMRMFTAVPAHATFAVLMGYYTGLAKFKKYKQRYYLGAGLLSATLLHGLYDYFLMQDSYPLLTLGAFVSLAIGIYLSFKAIKLHNNRSPFNPENSRI